MSDLRTAAQQALEALEYAQQDRECPSTTRQAITALRAALAQQAEPLNLRDPAVQKRLATQWGYVPAAQAEPVEPVAWLAPDGSVRETPAAKSFGEWVWGPDDFRPLYAAPPQRKPLPKHDQHCVDVPGYGLMAVRLVRAVERAHGIKE